MTDTTLISLLARAETPCTTGCHDGTIDNRAARDAWYAEHSDELLAFKEERRRTRSAWVGPEERALTDTEPRPFLACACNGAGYVLTADGEALVLFLKRHLLGLGEAR